MIYQEKTNTQKTEAIGHQYQKNKTIKISLSKARS